MKGHAGALLPKELSQANHVTVAWVSPLSLSPTCSPQPSWATITVPSGLSALLCSKAWHSCSRAVLSFMWLIRVASRTVQEAGCGSMAGLFPGHGIGSLAVSLTDLAWIHLTLLALSLYS